MSSLWLIRHSERLDHVNKRKWRNSYRYKQNRHDTPLSKYGFKIAKKAAKKIYDKEDNVKDIKKKYSWMSQAQCYIQLKKDGMSTVEIEKFSIQESKHVDKWIKRYHEAKKMDSDVRKFSNGTSRVNKTWTLATKKNF